MSLRRAYYSVLIGSLKGSLALNSIKISESNDRVTVFNRALCTVYLGENTETYVFNILYIFDSALLERGR